jgi:hypothetical protein
MNTWVVVALVVNAALVVVAILFAMHLAGRSVIVAVELELQLHLPPVVTAEVDEGSRLPLFSPAQMSKTEWRALLEAFDGARAVYLKELTAWRNRVPRVAGSLSRATHDLNIARWRWTRFERQVSAGTRLDELDER